MIRRLLIILGFLLAVAPCRAQVVYEAVGSVGVASATSASFSITLGGASATRAVEVQLAFQNKTVSAITVTVGGASAALVAGTDTGSAYTTRTMIYGLHTTLTGAQTVAVAWTTSSNLSVGAISATGADATTPFNNGLYTGSSSASIGITVTSNSGDLTTSVVAYKPYNTTATTNQVQKWTAANAGGTTVAGRGDIGPGTGTTNHTWTNASFTTAAMSACNIQQSTGAGGSVVRSSHSQGWH